jgi:hypothetical protein
MSDGHELGYPTLDDFAYHLTRNFPVAAGLWARQDRGEAPK